MNTLSFEGDGKVSVSVAELVKTEQFKRTVEAVREIAEASDIVYPVRQS